MRRADSVDSLQACCSLNGSLLRCEAELILRERCCNATIQNTDLVILALLVNLIFLVVLYKSITRSDACSDDFW